MSGVLTAKKGEKAEKKERERVCCSKFGDQGKQLCWDEGASPVIIWRKTIHARGGSEYKGPEAGAYLACGRNIEKMEQLGLIEWRRECRSKVREETSAQIIWGLVHLGKGFGFYFEWDGKPLKGLEAKVMWTNLGLTRLTLAALWSWSQGSKSREGRPIGGRLPKRGEMAWTGSSRSGKKLLTCTFGLKVSTVNWGIGCEWGVREGEGHSYSQRFGLHH